MLGFVSFLLCSLRLYEKHDWTCREESALLCKTTQFVKFTNCLLEKKWIGHSTTCCTVYWPQQRHSLIFMFKCSWLWPKLSLAHDVPPDSGNWTLHYITAILKQLILLNTFKKCPIDNNHSSKNIIGSILITETSRKEQMMYLTL